MTVGLCLIVKIDNHDQVEQLQNLVADAGRFVDNIYITFTSKGKFSTEAKQWLQPGVGHPHQTAPVHISDFKWVDDFSKARNFNLSQVKDDFWFWIDLDDKVDGLENLKTVLRQMEDQKADSAMFLYHYAKNPLGEEIADHWKDRIMRTSHPWKWEGVIHENPHSKAFPVRLKSDLLTINHIKEPEDYFASLQRNHDILEREYEKHDDPRITFYLARSYFTFQEYDKAIELSLEHIRTSGSVEDQYQSWIFIARSHQKLGDLHKAIKACYQATELLPEWPDAYLLIGELYYGLDDPKKALEWFKVGLSKPAPKTLQMHDPTGKHRAIMLGALSELSLGRVEDAWELYTQVYKLSPKTVEKYSKLFEDTYLEHKAITNAKWLIRYLRDNKLGQPQKIFEALPGELAMDIRLNPERSSIYPPKKWPKKSIVFFCGVSTGTWGADTLDKGMGGSEEAVVYLSRELVKLGWAVTVYNDRTEEYKDYLYASYDMIDGKDHVLYLPWNTFNPKDEFDVIVAWRMPEILKDIKARRKLVDLHDVMDADQIEAASKWVDTFLVKSNYHRSLFPNVPDDKFVVISNGIVRQQFGN